MSERIKPTISGSAETMLQSFYARAQYSKSKHNKFYDAKAVELIMIFLQHPGILRWEKE